MIGSLLKLFNEVKTEITEKSDDIEENVEQFVELVEKEVAFHSRNWDKYKEKIRETLDSDPKVSELKEQVNHLVTDLRYNTNMLYDRLKEKISAEKP